MKVGGSCFVGLHCRSPAVNFINIIHSHFSYKFLPKAKMLLEKAAETTFVRKICTFHIDEIDYRKDARS